MKRQGVADNPVLIGAGAILVVLVMVMLSYNANQGLPFVPTYNITVEVPSGANLVKGNDVRIGGARVGLVSKITARKRSGRYFALLSLKLDQKIGPIPLDSTILVRARSTLGLKYIQLTLGKSKQDLAAGGTLPLSQSSRATEFEDLLDTFNRRVREGNKRSLREFGNAFAGRGQDLNVAFGELPQLFENLQPVARTISDPATRLGDFIVAIANAAVDTAAAGHAAGEVWANADRTFAAFAAASQGIQDTLVESPPTLDVLTTEFPKQRPYLRRLTRTIQTFQPGAPDLPAVSENLAVITVRGTPALAHLSRTTPKFTKFFNTLGDFAGDPQVQMGVKGLVTFVQVINEPLAFLTPAQTVCNYGGLWARNLASTVSNGEGAIGWLRFALTAGSANGPGGVNSEGGAAAAPASQGASGTSKADYLHANPYPYTAAPGQPDICAAGNEITKGQKTLSPNARLAPNVLTGNPTDIKGGARTEDTQVVDQGATKR
ncbi:MAG: MCE family protein [Thermoleophilia bacterium]|nr:MCE family protein [Thermoleophilia bacterium]